MFEILGVAPEVLHFTCLEIRTTVYLKTRKNKSRGEKKKKKAADHIEIYNGMHVN